MKTLHDDSDTTDFIDGAAMSFMALTVSRLNEVLKSNGIADAQTRQKICASFLFDFAYHLDAGWLIHEGQKIFPVVTMAERAAPTIDQNLGPIEQLHVPTQASSWHEYAHGVVSQYFDEDGEQILDLRFGSYDIESQTDAV